MACCWITSGSNSRVVTLGRLGLILAVLALVRLLLHAYMNRDPKLYLWAVLPGGFGPADGVIAACMMATNYRCHPGQRAFSRALVNTTGAPSPRQTERLVLGADRSLANARCITDRHSFELRAGPGTGGVIQSNAFAAPIFFYPGRRLDARTVSPARRTPGNPSSTPRGRQVTNFTTSDTSDLGAPDPCS